MAWLDTARVWIPTQTGGTASWTEVEEARLPGAAQYGILPQVTPAPQRSLSVLTSGTAFVDWVQDLQFLQDVNNMLRLRDQTTEAISILEQKLLDIPSVRRAHAERNEKGLKLFVFLDDFAAANQRLVFGAIDDASMEFRELYIDFLVSPLASLTHVHIDPDAETLVSR